MDCEYSGGSQWRNPKQGGSDRLRLYSRTLLEVHMARRDFLRQLLALPLMGSVSAMGQAASHKTLNIMMKSAWGSDDPTKAAFPFLHGAACADLRVRCM